MMGTTLRWLAVAALLGSGCSVVNAPQDGTSTGGTGGTVTTGGHAGEAGSGAVGGQDCGPLNTLANCGACGQPCAPANASVPTCLSGTCDYGSCSGTFKDCDGDRTNGCESDPATDVENCGACNQPCDPAHFANVDSVTCTNSSCDYHQCLSAYADCDGNRQNGCERPANTLSDCGGCTLPCAPANANGPTCAAGTCGYATCVAPYADCDGNTANGCEANTQADDANCGGCNSPCINPAHCTANGCQSAVVLQNEIAFNGYHYATIDDVPPAAPLGTWANDCQTNYVTMPMGWELAPEDAAVVTNVIAVNIWSTHCILFSDGVSYGVQTYNGGGACGCSGLQCMSQSGDQWAVTSCNRRILIRRPG
jgi:hypothetical protein